MGSSVYHRWMEQNEVSELERDLLELESRYHEEAAALRARVTALEGALGDVASAFNAVLKQLRTRHTHDASLVRHLDSEPWIEDSRGEVQPQPTEGPADDVPLPGTTLTLNGFYRLFDWCLAKIKDALPRPDDEPVSS